MKLTINKEDVRNKDLSHLNQYQDWSPHYHLWNTPAGESEYKLYAYLSQKFNNTAILEVGTRYGGSTVAFSDNPTNKVIGYDIMEWTTHSTLNKENIDLRIGNFMEDDTLNYDEISIIMIDVDPHDGVQEPPMLKFLEEKKWKGLLILDDIGPEWAAIEKMWNELPYEKYDVTDIGHWSGTGIINFGKKLNIEIV